MNAAILSLIKSAETSYLLAFIVFLRVGATMALMPGFGEKSVPIRIRLLLAIMFTIVLIPMISEEQAQTVLTFAPKLLLTETISGLAIGLFFRLFVIMLQLAGTIAAQATSLSQIFGGSATPDPMPAFGNVLVIGGLALAMATGLHVKLVIALADTYKVLPIGTLPARSDLTEWGISGVSHAFSIAFSLAAPFIIASVIYNVALGAINRAMPQLQVAFIGAPAITLGGLAILAVATPVILYTWISRFDAGLSNPFGAFW